MPFSLSAPYSESVSDVSCEVVGVCGSIGDDEPGLLLSTLTSLEVSVEVRCGGPAPFSSSSSSSLLALGPYKIVQSPCLTLHPSSLKAFFSCLPTSRLGPNS